MALAAGNASLAEHGLKARSYSVLALPASDARPSQRELAEFLRLDPSQVVGLVDGLQARGLVRREPDPPIGAPTSSSPPTRDATCSPGRGSPRRLSSSSCTAHSATTAGRSSWSC